MSGLKSNVPLSQDYNLKKKKAEPKVSVKIRPLEVTPEPPEILEATVIKDPDLKDQCLQIIEAQSGNGNFLKALLSWLQTGT